MDQEDIEEIIKEWSEEWKNFIENVSDFDDDDTPIDKDKGKEKVGEKNEKEHISEKRKASHDELRMHKRWRWGLTSPLQTPS